MTAPDLPTCRRCGVRSPGQVGYPLRLCRDCRGYLRQHHELDAWTPPPTRGDTP